MASNGFTWEDSTGGIPCAHGIRVVGIELVDFNRDLLPSLPKHCEKCKDEQLELARLDQDLFMDLEEVTDGDQSGPILWYDSSLPADSQPKDMPDRELASRLKNLAVADQQVHAIPQPQPTIKAWQEDTLERRFENLSTQEKGFSRSDTLHSDYCPHGHLIYREVLVDRFSPYDGQMHKPLAEQCPECCFAFVCKELHEIRYGFMKRRNQEDAYTRDNVGPTMHRIRLQWQWIWAVRWKEHKWRSEWGESNPEGGTSVFEEELHLATEGWTIELPKQFNAGYGRWPGFIMR